MKAISNARLLGGDEVAHDECALESCAGIPSEVTNIRSHTGRWVSSP
jgi:hypothetical protein